MASESGVLYVGVTSNLLNRVKQHKEKSFRGFSQKYNCNKLVYYESYNDVIDAIAREKEIKKWRREKKLKLISDENPGMEDLSVKFKYFN